jgi:hypothetical protein
LEKYDVFTYFTQNPDGTKEYFYNGQTIIISKENGGFIGIKKVVDAVNYPVFSYKEVPDNPKRIRLYKNNAFVGQIWLNSDVAKKNVTQIIFQLNYTDTNGTEFKYNVAKFGN